MWLSTADVVFTHMMWMVPWMDSLGYKSCHIHLWEPHSAAGLHTVSLLTERVSEEVLL